MIDAVQDHLGHGALALAALAAGFEIKRLGKALQIALADLGLGPRLFRFGNMGDLGRAIGQCRGRHDRRQRDCNTHGNARQP